MRGADWGSLLSFYRRKWGWPPMALPALVYPTTLVEWSPRKEGLNKGGGLHTTFSVFKDSPGNTLGRWP